MVPAPKPALTELKGKLNSKIREYFHRPLSLPERL